jgi:hypothetical protein
MVSQYGDHGRPDLTVQIDNDLDLTSTTTAVHVTAPSEADMSITHPSLELGRQPNASTIDRGLGRLNCTSANTAKAELQHTSPSSKYDGYTPLLSANSGHQFPQVSFVTENGLDTCVTIAHVEVSSHTEYEESFELSKEWILCFSSARCFSANDTNFYLQHFSSAHSFV